MDDFTKFLTNIDYLQVIQLLFKWGIPLVVVTILTKLAMKISAYVMIRSDKHIAIGKCIEYNGFKGKIVALTMFEVIIENEKGDIKKVSPEDFKDITYLKTSLS